MSTEGGQEAPTDEKSMSPVETPPEAPKEPKEENSDSDGEAKIKIDEGECEKTSQDGLDEKVPESPSSNGPSSDGYQESAPTRSSASSNEKAKEKEKKKEEPDPAGHEVTFTVTISIAVPTVEDEDQPDLQDLVKKKKRTFEAPKAQNYYHLEYYLVPGNDELVKTDVVTYGMGAKVYMEKCDPVVKKIWTDGEITWIAWAQKHKMIVTKELLLKLYTHTLEVRIWDTKDKVGTRAKFDRPKLFKLPTLKPGNIASGEDIDDLGGVKGMVIKQNKSYTNLQPSKDRSVRPLPTEISVQRSDEKGNKRKDAAGDKAGVSPNGEKMSGNGTTSPTPHTLVGVPVKDNDMDGRISFSRLGRLADVDSGTLGRTESRNSKISSKKARTQSQNSKARTMDTSTPQTGKARQDTKSSASAAGSTKAKEPTDKVQGKRSKTKKSDPGIQSAADQIKKYGVACVRVQMVVLFAGVESLTNRLEKPVLGIEDMFVTVNLNTPLLNLQQKKELNPMIVRVKSASNLPATPMSMDQLKQKCMPAYCKYNFFNLKPHITTRRPHASNVYWEDINVILAGTFEQSEFRQYLNGPPLEIQVHDRDRKTEDICLKATLFGDDLEDEKISNVGTITSRRTIHNPFKDKNKVWDPYGVGKVDLSDLLLGQTYMHLKIPVHPCPPPDLLGRADGKAGKVMGLAGAVDGPTDTPLPAGHYMSSHTMLKLKIELSHPLTTPEDVAAKKHLPGTNECPFSRIIFKFDYKNTLMLSQIQMLITGINARALELDDMPQHVIDAALSTYKLSGFQQQSRTLDIITGFQILDRDMHLFVLEGLRDRAIKQIWEELPRPENSDVTVLYHSNLTFSHRLYGPLDVDLCRVKLHEPLKKIVQQPLLYVRDMVPKSCFQALTRLNELTKKNSIKEVVRNNLFPTADMIVSVSKEFGVPFTSEDFEELQVKDERSFRAEANTTTQEQSFVRESSHYFEPIDNQNFAFMERLVDREKQGATRDFIKEHKTEVKKVSEINKREKEMNKPLTVKVDVDVAHNYSTQSLNSTEMAREKLRQILAKEPDTRYTYCQDYLHSMTVVPVNVEALKKQEKLESKARWKTEDGWVYPGMKTLLEDNENPKRPATARLDELSVPWRENALHRTILVPPLDRDNFPWDLRNQDMDLYRKPVDYSGDQALMTVQVSAETIRREKLAAKQQLKDDWESKILVKDTRQYFHRCLAQTEMQLSGPQSSNQLARLEHILKDPAQKLTLKRPPMALQNIPPLSVVNNPSVDTDARLAGIIPKPAVENEQIESNCGFKPGAYAETGWLLERNKIPAIDYEHAKFDKLKGHDFNVYHKERARMWRRPIVPLHDDERDNHLFRIPDDQFRFPVLPELPRLGERSQTLPEISTMTLNQSQNSVAAAINEATIRMGMNVDKTTGSLPMAQPTPQLAN